MFTHKEQIRDWLKQYLEGKLTWEEFMDTFSTKEVNMPIRKIHFIPLGKNKVPKEPKDYKHWEVLNTVIDTLYREQGRNKPEILIEDGGFMLDDINPPDWAYTILSEYRPIVEPHREELPPP